MHRIALSLLVATLAGCATPGPFVTRPYWVEIPAAQRPAVLPFAAEAVVRGAAQGAVIGAVAGAPALGAAAGGTLGWIEGRTLGAREALDAGRRAQRARWIWEQQRRTAAAYEQALAGGPSTPGYR